MPADRRPTLEVVAARAGVSRATASRVLRGNPNVSEVARDSVLRAAQEIDYTVNRAARSLVTQRSDTVAFLVAESPERTFADPYFPAVLRGAQAEAAHAEMQLVFVIASDAAQLDQFQRYVAGGHVDGVLLVSLHGNDEVAGALEALGVPTVLNGRPLAQASGLYSVDADNLGGATLATEALLQRGCRYVATITGPLDMSVGQDRLAGFRAALAGSGDLRAGERVQAADFTMAGGMTATRRLLHAHPGIDGLFVASDLMALGALRALQESGRRVPQDVAVIGFDDVREAQLSVPPLSTVRQPLDDLGRTMARVLFDRINGAQVVVRTVLGTELVLRESA